jgi:hypothetical protein
MLQDPYIKLALTLFIIFSYAPAFSIVIIGAVEHWLPPPREFLIMLIDWAESFHLKYVWIYSPLIFFFCVLHLFIGAMASSLFVIFLRLARRYLQVVDITTRREAYVEFSKFAGVVSSMLMISIIQICLFGYIFAGLGISDSSNGEILFDFQSGFYLSLTTWTTIGFGNTFPAGNNPAVLIACYFTSLLFNATFISVFFISVKHLLESKKS